MNKEENRRRILLGLGFDNDDGHKRITRSEELYIAGGSAETHERMAETALKTFEDLRHKGKTLATVEREELAELLEKNTPKE
jgi:hypothetical protein